VVAKKADEGIKPGNVAMAVIVAAALAGMAGWYARGTQGPGGSGSSPGAGGKPALSSSAQGAAGPDGVPALCASWSKRICDSAGEDSEGCQQAKTAASILPASVCQGALGEVDATLARLKQSRGVCDQLIEKACNDLGKETETCKMVRERTVQFPSTRCRELLDKYADVLGELKQMEKRNAPLAPEVVAKLAEGDAPGFGPKDAKVLIVEFSDFQCPYCSEAAKTVEQIRKRYGKTVRFVFRQFPLSIHKTAALAAEASLAAHAQGKFWAFQDLLFANQQAQSRADLDKYAKQAGLDLAKFGKALDDNAYKAAVDQDLALGAELGVEGTPTIVVGTQRVEDPRNFEAISTLIDAQLTAAGVAVPKAED
jgi:protein-disulfide isomerase